LGLTEIDIFDGKALLQYHLIFVLIGLISILITFFNIGITIGLPGWIYGLLGPVLFWDGRYQNKKKLNKFGSQQGNNNSKGG
jgi:membrane associated rhomboid family serine protease